MFSSCPKMRGRFMFSCVCSNTRIFIVAPIIGGILAWLVWKKVLCDDDAE